MDSGMFVSSFCKPQTFHSAYKNILGGFTPCFCDIVLLGVCQSMLLIFGAIRLVNLKNPPPTGQRHVVKYRIVGSARLGHVLAMVLCCICALIPFVQLNARIAQLYASTSATRLAPYEGMGFVLAILSYSMAAIVINFEKDRFLPDRTYLIRMPLVATFAAQLAKLRSVVILEDNSKTYFFWLFVCLTALQGMLALWAIIFACPRRKFLQNPVADDMWHSDYEALPSSLPENLRPQGKTVCPEATAGLWGILTFSWISPLLIQGYKRPLEFKDIWEVPPSDRVQRIGRAFEDHWKEQQDSGSASVFNAAWSTVAPLFLTALPFKVLNDASQFVGPISITLILSSIARGDSALRSYAYACAMLAGLSMGFICEAQYWQRSMRAGFQLRAALVAAVYRKILVLTAGARTTYSRGFIYNLVTSDADSVQQVCNQIFTLVSGPARIIVAMFLLYEQLGVAAFAALVLLICVIPVQMACARLSAEILRQGMLHSDERTKLESDIIAGIEALKTQAWEAYFLSAINTIRDLELAVLWKSFILAGVNTLLLQTIPTIVTIATFSLYVLLGNTLTAAKAFTALALFSVLRFPLFQLPMVVNNAVRAGVAFRRFKEFLSSAESPLEPPLPASGPRGIAVRLQGTLTWAAALPPVLHYVDFTARTGELVAIVGATGSGKTTFLTALLGLTEAMHDFDYMVAGTVAYVSQQAFIFGGTVQENILFESEWDAERYERAISAANLAPDLEQFAAGDQTELGEGGINVSGGQKQRIQLARAVYSNPDVVLLDDPLSALDSKVGRRVFQQCVQEEFAGKTRLLVTNQLQYVPEANTVVVLKDGEVAEVGKYKALMARNGLLSEMMMGVRDDKGEGKEKGSEPSSPAKQLPAPAKAAAAVVSHAGVLTASVQRAAAQRVTDPATAANGGRLVEKESRAQGVVALEVLLAYVHAMGGYVVFVWLIVTYVTVECIRVSATVWLSIWTASSEDAKPSLSEEEEGGVVGDGARKGPMFYLLVFCAISILQILVATAAQFQMRYLSISAGRKLHAGMLTSLLSAPMSFFHQNPSGRIINRLTKDTADIDRNLSSIASMWFVSMLQLVSTAVVVGSVTPFVLPFLVPLLLIFCMLYLYFQASVREVKRLDALARSPIFTAVTSSLTGLATIKSFRREETLYERTCELIDVSSVMQLCNQSMNRWLSLRLESVGSMIAFAAAALVIEQRGQAAWMGLTLTYALTMTSLTTMAVRLASLAENNFNAVERVDEFSHIPPEGKPPQLPDDVVPKDAPLGFPCAGAVAFERVEMRYRPGLPLVLKGLSFSVPAGSTVGIVGRTGAGKSTVINAVYRLCELSSGRIVIDGVDAATLTLSSLRRAIALIPQVPVLFNASLRTNLAPTGEYSDSALWAALESSHLAAMVRHHPEGLEMRLSDGGRPLAAGQMQLVALARALLKRSHLLILDEATANVDTETDQLIQHTIREAQAGTTIAVAHRLNTVIDCDSILVMHAGKAAEFASPKTLLADKGGIFTSMVNETGKATAKMLRGVATGATSLKETRLEAAQAASRSAANASPPRNGLSVTEQLVRETEEADLLLQSLVQVMEDKEQTQLLMQRYSAEGAVDAAAAGVANSEIAANLTTVSTLMSNVRSHLETMQSRMQQPLEGVSVSDVSPSAAGAASASAFATQEEPIGKFRTAVDRVRTMGQIVKLVRKPDAAEGHQGAPREDGGLGLHDSGAIA